MPIFDIGICDGSSGTDGGTFADRRCTRGGLELRNELERATCDVFGKTMPFGAAEAAAVAVLLLNVDFTDAVSSAFEFGL